jgi:hypothetical protein
MTLNAVLISVLLILHIFSTIFVVGLYCYIDLLNSEGLIPGIPEEVIPEAQPLMPSVVPSEIMEIITSPVIDTVGLFNGLHIILILASIALFLKAKGL